MNVTNLRLLVVHIVIPFVTGAGLGAVFLGPIYWLDVGGMRTLLAASGGDILEIGLVPVACAFGALAIGTNQAIGSLREN